MSTSEERKLDAIAGTYDPFSPEMEFDYWFVRLGFEAIAKLITRGGSALELGCSTGLMTSLLARVVGRLVICEGSSVNIEIACQRVAPAANLSYIHSLWEEFNPDRSFDDIVLAGALEHVADPVSILTRAAGWLSPFGRIHVVVPNARSLHRRVGKYMGCLGELHDLNESDVRIGHRRVYDRDSLLSHIHQAGLSVLHWEGILLKPLSNAQMQGWSESLVRALHEVGRELPDYCGEIYACCGPANSEERR
ncbi:MAG: class I SAM-dependent methyltransferase [Chloroflexi bacterium]|nr:class I SAM-dependent methyltransferase [Chloroflexota bacterium]